MNEIRSCKRCSIKRVNALCELFEKANHQKDEKARKKMDKLIYIANKRGYKLGQGIWDPGLTKGDVRSICWNISSLLKEEDFIHLGVDIRQQR